MAARSGKPREPRRNEPRGVGTWKRARRRHLGSPHSTRNRLRLTKRRRAYAAAGRSDLVPSRTRPGANFRRLRARQSKGTSRLVGRDSRQSETRGRTAQPSVISLREAPIRPADPANRVVLRLRVDGLGILSRGQGPGARLRGLGPPRPRAPEVGDRPPSTREDTRFHPSETWATATSGSTS